MVEKQGTTVLGASYQAGLEIIRILEDIPLTSSTRCIQPLLYLTAGTLLYLTAGTVLKFDVPTARPVQLLSSMENTLGGDLREADSPLSTDSTLVNRMRWEKLAIQR